MKKKIFKYIFSFRHFVVVEEYDEDNGYPDFYIYGRVSLFVYQRLGMADSMLWEEMYDFKYE